MTNSLNPQDVKLFATIRQRLFTAVLGDVMDVAGLTRQFLPAHIRALVPDTTIVGRAMPVLEADCAADVSKNAQPFGLMFEALDDLKAGEIYICTGGSPRYALWGGLMSTRAKTLGAHGAVLDGFIATRAKFWRSAFRSFSTGSYAQESAHARSCHRLPLPD